MNKKLIQQLLDDDKTRLAIARMFRFKMEGDDRHKSSWDYDDLMISALNKLNDTLVKGEMITIEVSHHMWVRGEYVCAEPDGRLLVSIPGKNPGSCVTNEELHAGKRVDLAVKGEEGETT
jgi:hypothetical protein